MHKHAELGRVAVLAVFDEEWGGSMQPVLDAWSAVPGTGLESKGGELGGTSDEHKEGGRDGPKKNVPCTKVQGTAGRMGRQHPPRSDRGQAKTCPSFRLGQQLA